MAYRGARLALLSEKGWDIAGKAGLLTGTVVRRNEAIGREQGSAVDLASGVAPAGVELPAVVPPGWERTPSMGKPIPLGAASPPLAVLMPMKVPIGEKWADKVGRRGHETGVC